MKKRNVYIFLVLFIYLACYPAVRASHLLIHAKGYMTKNGERIVVEHSVRQGDFGIPVFSLLKSIAALVASLVYFPIKPIEVMYHYATEPKGSPWHE